MGQGYWGYWMWYADFDREHETRVKAEQERDDAVARVDRLSREVGWLEMERDELRAYAERLAGALDLASDALHYNVGSAAHISITDRVDKARAAWREYKDGV